MLRARVLRPLIPALRIKESNIRARIYPLRKNHMSRQHVNHM